MAMFHLETSFMLEVIAFAAGLVLLHFGKAGSAALLRAAGWVMVVASLTTAVCTVYYGIRYHVQGEFDHAYGGSGGCPGKHACGAMGGRHGGMGGMGMGHRHEGTARMQGGMGMHGQGGPHAGMVMPPSAAEPSAEAAPPAPSEGEADATP